MINTVLRTTTCLILIATLVIAPMLSFKDSVYGKSNDKKVKKSINKMIKTAKKKKGKSIGSFPGYFNKGRWCADFVYWATKKTKLNNNKVYPKKKTNVSGIQKWYKKRGKYRKNTKKYNPKRGDLAFFSTSSHVAIVTKVTKKHVYVVHGNWSNKVKVTKLNKRGYTSSQKAKIKGFAKVAC